MSKSSGRKNSKPSNQKYDPAIIVALIGLVGTVLTALIAPIVIEMVKQKLAEPSVAKTATPAVAVGASSVTNTPLAQSSTATITNSVFTSCPSEMVTIPAGLFRMGAAPGDVDAEDNEKPPSEIMLNAFCIDRTEVSNGQYANGSGQGLPPSVNPKLPKVDVTWYEADQYCRQKGYGLPTEAQWEKAARGEKPLIYPWGNTWESDRANSGKTAPRGLRAVTDYANGASPYGVLNMAGNVAEWVADWYLPDWYGIMPHENPFMRLEPVNADKTKVVRGGSFVHQYTLLRTSARHGTYEPEQRFDYIGFRCAVQLQPP